MGYKSKVFGVRKIDLDAEYWAEVSPLTKAEDDECQRVLLGGDLEGTVGDASSVKARFHQREYTDQLLLAGIKRWNLDGEDGAVLPISVEHIRGLADAHSTALLAAIRGLTAPLADPKGSKTPA